MPSEVGTIHGALATWYYRRTAIHLNHSDRRLVSCPNGICIVQWRTVTREGLFSGRMIQDASQAEKYRR